MRLIFAVILILTFLCCVFGQTYNIQTLAGGGITVNIPGTSASLHGPASVAVDKAGNLYFSNDATVLRLDPSTGAVTLVAGNGTVGRSGDGGPATNAQLFNPKGVTVDTSGNLYIADTTNNRIRKVSNGVITTVAGNGTRGYSGDGGLATDGELYDPSGVAVDATGDLYIADTTNNRIRKVSNGVITTVAGNGTSSYSGDGGPATSAGVYDPLGVAVDATGNLYIAEQGRQRIRKVANGVITTVAGGENTDYSGDSGRATSARLHDPLGVAVDATGNLYITEDVNPRIRKISNGVITTVAGNGTWGYSGDGGPATSAQMSRPHGVAVDASGNLYIADSGNNRIRKVSNGVISTVAGGGIRGDGGPASSAELRQPRAVAVDASGDLYIADTYNNRIRKVSGGVIATIEGNGNGGYSSDGGPATSAQHFDPHGIVVDASGNLYISGNEMSHGIRKVAKGLITTVAGKEVERYGGYSGDGGPAASAQLAGPKGVAVDASGNLYIADTYNHRIRKVSKGVISTVVGNGFGLYGGDNGPPTRAELYYPSGVAVDASGNLYIADTGNNRIRKVSNGVITTVAGNGTWGYSGDGGPATSAQLHVPSAVAVDALGNLYIADSGNNRIRKVSGGLITTIAGNGTRGFNGDGAGTSVELNDPSSVAVDAAGTVYVADHYNDRVRALIPSGPSCSFSAIPTSLNPPSSGGSFTVSIRTGSSCAWTVSNLPTWITVKGNSSGSGNGNVTLRIADSASGDRVWYPMVAGLTVTVKQLRNAGQ